jgi:hypothetical protein
MHVISILFRIYISSEAEPTPTPIGTNLAAKSPFELVQRVEFILTLRVDHSLAATVVCRIHQML